MAASGKDDKNDSRKMAVSGTQTYADFEGSCQRIYLVSDVDCFITFDEVATTSGLLIKADQSPVWIETSFNTIHAVTAGGTGSLYILAIR